MKKNFCLTALFFAMFVGCEIKNESEISNATPTEITPTTPAMEARPAEVGVGLKGQSLKNETGIGKAIAQPAIVLFQTKEKIAFEVQIPQALSLFKASEGRGPESNDEFMEKIIKANRIKLPKLPEGQEYQYHPDDEKLWVHPKASN